MELTPVHDLLPHQSPMVLIDHLIDVGDTDIHCRVHINKNHLFFDKETNAVPGWVGIEMMAQTIAAWSGFHALQANQQPKVGFLLGSRRYKAQCARFSDGVVLNIKASQLFENNGMAVFDCAIFQHGEEVASAQLNTYVPSEEKRTEIAASEVNEDV